MILFYTNADSSSCPVRQLAPSSPIEVFHTRDQNHVTAGGDPFWGLSFATAAVAVVYMLSKLAANLAKESRNVHTK